MTTPMSCPAVTSLLVNAGSKCVSATVRNWLAGALLVRTAPEKTMNFAPTPTTAGSRQWAAVSTTWADTTAPVHRLALVEFGTWAATSTTDGSPMSLTPLMIGCSRRAGGGGAPQPARAQTTA